MEQHATDNGGNAPAVHHDRLYNQNEKDPTRGSLDEFAIASAYSDGNDVLYDEEAAQWFAYKEATGLWKSCGDALMRRSMAEYLGRVLPTGILHLRTSSKIRGILDHLAGVALDEEEPPRNERLIHVANGMLVIGPDGFELKPFDREYRSRNRTEIAWDENAECPRLKTELLGPAMSEEDIKVVQRYLGQCLLGRNLSQRILILRGTAGGGKSTLVNLIEKVVGQKNATELRVSILNNRFEIGQLDGHTLLTGKDVPGDFLNCKGANRLKALVGNDRVKCEPKDGNDTHEVDGDFNAVITSNNRLRLRLDMDRDAWRRRLILVDYDRTPPEKVIADLKRVLIEEEGPGILRWAAEGARELLVELDAGNGFPLSDAQRDRVDCLLDESDSLAQFVAERVEKKNGDTLTSNELCEEYKEFCMAQGWSPCEPGVVQRTLPDIIRSKFSVGKATDITRGGRNQRGYRNLRVRAA